MQLTSVPKPRAKAPIDMAKANEHGRLITAAAKSILGPLGCRQVGRSRTWIADQRFWVIVIEFQPSSYSKGTYLNVGVCWLWHAKAYWSFDYGDRIRVGGFESFESEDQFSLVAEEFATRAADEVRLLRRRLASLRAIAEELAASEVAGWPRYHAAVATGLLGRTDDAERIFARLIEQPVTFDWEKELQAASMELRRLLPDTRAFRAAIRKIVDESRELHRLPPDDDCFPGI